MFGYEFTSARGERIAVVAHRGGRQDLSLYDQHDADTCRTILELDSDDAATLASILGVPQVAASASAMQRVEGLALDWVTVTDRLGGSRLDDRRRAVPKPRRVRRSSRSSGSSRRSPRPARTS